MSARLVTLLVALTVALAPTAAAADGWHSEQPLTPGSTVPAALGRVYDLQFWAPNRGLLLTEKGLWAYDGAGWHPYATVCGGTDGKIVWAGPTDFWTISDQPVGQANPTGESRAARSLCHFVNGAVVASYAQPLGQAGSYLPMSGGACTAPDDCWFGGARLPGTVNTGAFHLHWDGTALTPWPSLAVRDSSLTDPDRAVAAMAVHQGVVYESVDVAGNVVAGEPDDQPFLLHEVQPGTPPAFTSLLPLDPIAYGTAAPQDAAGLTLTSDGEGLWGVAGAKEPSVRPAGPVVMRLGPSGLAPVALNDPQGYLTANAFLRSAAAEPGTSSVWVAYYPPLEADASVVQLARLVRIGADGAVGDPVALPGPADGIARKGRADRVACAAPGQCWLATETGWLFHLGDPLARDDEPAMHRLITYRPSDAATVVVSPDTLPDDDSGIAPPIFEQPPPEGYTPPQTGAPKAKAKRLVTGVKRKMIGRTTLQISFTLTAKARVQLLAKRKKTVVARTKRRTLAKGKHKVTLKLDRKRWPTALDLRAEAAR